MSKHTPGPRELYSPCREEQYIDVALPEALEDGTDMRPIFRVHHDRTIPDATAEANARLIAAAPELLHALKHLTGLVGGMAGVMHHPEVHYARDVLAKVEGRE